MRRRRGISLICEEIRLMDQLAEGCGDTLLFRDSEYLRDYRQQPGIRRMQAISTKRIVRLNHILDRDTVADHGSIEPLAEEATVILVLVERSVAVHHITVSNP